MATTGEDFKRMNTICPNDLVPILFKSCNKSHYFKRSTLFAIASVRLYDVMLLNVTLIFTVFTKYLCSLVTIFLNFIINVELLWFVRKGKATLTHENTSP